jgi:serine/threonine protein kinase
MDGNIEVYLSTDKSRRYKRLSRIGQGTYGDVCKGIDVYTGKNVALKFVRILARDTHSIPKAVFREVESLRHLQSPFICQLHDMYPDEASLVLVLEYLPYNLQEIISHTKDYFPRAHFKAYFKMLLEAIAHCHEQHIIHRDVKPSNILISSSGILKLGDFGLARLLPSPDKNLTKDAMPLSHQVATRWYRPPELLFGSQDYSFSVDVWSVGVVLAEMLLLAPLFPGTNDIDQIFRVFQIMGTPTAASWPVCSIVYVRYW